MDLFNIIPENFFSLLSSKNKRLYQSCIFKVFEVYEQSSILGIDKKIVVDDLVNYLSKTKSELVDDNLEELYEIDVSNKRELANYVLRRMEKCGWIFVDLTSEYNEIINFTDYAITIIEALLQIKPIYFDEFDMGTYNDEQSFHGYIYTIYSLLLNKDNVDYSLLISEIVKYTKLLLRSLRKLDSKLKDYLSSVVDAIEIKDLMEKLLDYKTEVFDSVYNRLKTTDNINKYRLEIVNSLEDIINSDEKMIQVIDGYLYKLQDYDKASKYAFRQINEVIEVFNTFDDLISLIDGKIKNYVKSTIGKIKFLLSEDDNIIGKLNQVFSYIKKCQSENKVEKAIDLLRKTITLTTIKSYEERSLYQPRGSYNHNLLGILDNERFDITSRDLDFINDTNFIYDEKNILNFLSNNLNNEVFKASEVISYNCSDDVVLQVVCTLLYATENGYLIDKLEETIKHYKFIMPDFTIRKGSI